MKRYALIGYPLSQSRSKSLHNELFKLRGIINSSYELIEIKPDVFKSELKNLATFNGFNVTIPYKEKVYKRLTNFDDTALICKSVNTVKRKEDGSLIGYNTDSYGFVRSIKEAKYSLCCKVLLVGCGGTGRMIAFEIAKAGGEVNLAIRESSTLKSELLKEDIKKTYPNAIFNIINLDKLENHKYDLLINATPCGMYPDKIEQLPLPKSKIKNMGAVFDVVHNPSPTRLILEAKKLGVTCCGGIKMLVLQAVKSHEIWNNVSYSKQEIEDLTIKIEKMNGRSF